MYNAFLVSIQSGFQAIASIIERILEYKENSYLNYFQILDH